MLAAQRGAAANTLAAYRRDLEQAEEMLGSELARTSPAQLARLGQGWSHLAPSTVARSAMSAAHQRPLMTATQSAPAAIMGAALSALMPPIATTGSPHFRPVCSVSSDAPAAPGLVLDGYMAPKAM